MMYFINFFLLILVHLVACQDAPAYNDIKFHEPSGPSGQPSPALGKGPPPRFSSYKPKHKDIRVNIDKEREHIKEQVKEDYMDISKLDDNKLLMQYFRKHDSDNNHKLDGLELLKAIARMEEDDHHHDDEDEEAPAEQEEKEPSNHRFNIEQIIPIVDSILEQDDKNKDGYLNWPEFISRQRTKN
eukprot:TRINITY_DN22326_c0_g1_i1.p1 TRINITY_DN22326_c0_g1~~TRINITY_DN22326_c0_g1_i1.p1  ORF type:complete len:185 (+),score=57.18 TRINITY_DN22326_c0_g1_i1:43-597(+)